MKGCSQVPNSESHGTRWREITLFLILSTESFWWGRQQGWLSRPACRLLKIIRLGSRVSSKVALLLANFGTEPPLSEADDLQNVLCAETGTWAPWAFGPIQFSSRHTLMDPKFTSHMALVGGRQKTTARLLASVRSPPFWTAMPPKV